MYRQVINHLLLGTGLRFRATSRSLVLATMAVTLVCPAFLQAAPAHGTLVVAINQEPQDLAAQGTYKEINATGLRNVLETLIAVDPVSGQFSPILATAWERLDDSTLRFTIRKGVRFHDGTDMTAEAVAASINWVWSPDNAFTIQEYAGPGEITASAVDAKTVEVKSSKADPLLEFRLSLNGISSAEQLENSPEKHFDTPIGTGPYKFSEWAKGQYWTASYNEDWWGHDNAEAYGTTAPTYSDLKFVFRSEDAARIAMVKSGEAQLAMFPSADECKRAADEADYDCVTGPSTTYLYGRLDHSLHANPVLQDVRVREAIFSGIDIAGIAELYGMASEPQGQLGPRGTIGFNDSVKAYNYDPERAMALLAEAKADGVDLDSLNVEVVGRDTTPRIKPVVEAIGAMLNIVGVDTTIKVQTPQEFNPRVRIAGYADEPGRQMMQVHVKQNPSGDYGLLLHSNYACPDINDPKGPSRSSVYCDEAFDIQLFDALASFGDDRSVRMQELVQYVHDRHLIVPLALLDRGYLVSAGTEFTFGTDHRIQAVYIKPSD